MWLSLFVYGASRTRRGAVQSELPVDVRDRGRPSAQFARESSPYYNPRGYLFLPSITLTPLQILSDYVIMVLYSTCRASAAERTDMKALKRLLKVLAIILAVVLVVFLTCLIGNAISRDNIEAYIDGFEQVVYESQLVPSTDELGNYYFVTDGDFKVMQITDVHLVGGFLFAENDKKALHAVASMIEAERPDLVIVTGDISYAVPWSGTLDNSIAHGYFKRLMEKLGVYWTVTFGNHDSEAYNYHNRAAVADMYSEEALQYCLFSAGPDGVFGECNHVINVQNTQGLITSSYVMIHKESF